MFLRPTIFRPLLAVFLAFGLEAQAGIYNPQNREPIYVKKYPGIVAIDRDYLSSASGGCAGSFISEDIILTAKHCPTSRFKLQAPQLKVYEGLVPDLNAITPKDSEWDGFTRVIESGILDDYALHRVVWFSGKKPRAIEPFQLQLNEPKVGQKVSIVGYPMDVEGFLYESHGEVVGLNFDKAEVHPGEVFTVYNCSQTTQNSGGPLIDQATSQILGVVSNSAPGTELDPTAKDLRLHSRSVPISLIYQQSEILQQLAKHGKENDPYLGSVVVRVGGNGRTFENLDIPLAAYPTPSGEVRLEFLSFSTKLKSIPSSCAKCGERYQMNMFNSGIFELNEVDGKRVLNVVEWPAEAMENILWLSPLNWYSSLFKTQQEPVNTTAAPVISI